jgi:sulfur relay (sulfurtransferase) complex TusBCD TusD component (DsrE family)
MKIRQQKETKTCPISSMRDLYSIVLESDRVITF